MFFHVDNEELRYENYKESPVQYLAHLTAHPHAAIADRGATVTPCRTGWFGSDRSLKTTDKRHSHTWSVTVSASTVKRSTHKRSGKKVIPHEQTFMNKRRERSSLLHIMVCGPFYICRARNYPRYRLKGQRVVDYQRGLCFKQGPVACNFHLNALIWINLDQLQFLTPKTLEAFLVVRFGHSFFVWKTGKRQSPIDPFLFFGGSPRYH